MHLDLDRAGRAAPNARPPQPDGAPAARRIARLLRHLPLFDGAVDEACDRAFLGATLVSVPAGTMLFEAGEPASALYVVLGGRVRLLLDCGGIVRVLSVLGRGDTVGMAALLRGDLYPVSAEVAADAELVAIPAATVHRLIAEHPAIAARLVGDLGARLARFVRDIGGFTQRSARARVARMLLDLRRETPGDTAELSYDEPKRAIASRLAMTPETLSRELAALAAMGLIESRRTRVRVLDGDGLARAAADGLPLPGPA
jgi:CRP-like cAMP-binding protein